jgi:hypothetical protein
LKGKLGSKAFKKPARRIRRSPKSAKFDEKDITFLPVDYDDEPMVKAIELTFLKQLVNFKFDISHIKKNEMKLYCLCPAKSAKKTNDLVICAAVVQHFEEFDSLYMFATNDHFKSSGFGQAMIAKMVVEKPMIVIPDDEAIEFYQKCGFKTIIGDKLAEFVKKRELKSTLVLRPIKKAALRPKITRTELGISVRRHNEITSFQWKKRNADAKVRTHLKTVKASKSVQQKAEEVIAHYNSFAGYFPYADFFNDLEKETGIDFTLVKNRFSLFEKTGRQKRSKRG